MSIKIAEAEPVTPASVGWWSWIPAHGGAGTSTLAASVPGGLEEARPDLPAVVVCRSHAGGLAAARATAGRLSAASRSNSVLGLVAVADAPGKLPKELAEGLRLTSGAYSRVWRVPWVEAWRLGEAPSPANVPEEVRGLLVDVWEILGLTLPTGVKRPRERRHPQ